MEVDFRKLMVILALGMFFFTSTALFGCEDDPEPSVCHQSPQQAGQSMKYFQYTPVECQNQCEKCYSNPADVTTCSNECPT